MLTYWGDEDRYVSDLNEAAEYAQATGDWSRYVQIQRRLAAESALSVLAPYAGELSALSHDRAVKEMDSRHPGFGELLEENRETLQAQRPKLAEAISFAEQDPRLQLDLLGLYESANDYLKVHGSGSGMQLGNTSREPSGDRTATDSRDLSSSASRQRVISSFEKKFGTDVEIDRADTSQHNIG